VPSSLVHLLDADPDLGAGLTATQRTLARAALVSPVERLRLGRWAPISDGEHYGALVLDGLLLREMVVAGQPSAEVIGAGDVLLPLGSDEVTFVPRAVSWRVLVPARVAWLGTPVLAGFVHWPALARTVLQRSERRVARVMAMQSLAHLSRVQDRLLGILWLLAERWGRVGADGVVLALPLTHRALGQLVGAKRPTVTGALGALEDDGLIDRLDAGWLLRGEPPAFLRSVAEAGHAQLDGAPPSGAVG
jgi:CRP/FNR family cyclic AMP-dependent transcriptional regulator